MSLPRCFYLNKPDKSDPLNLKRVLSAKWGDFFVQASWEWHYLAPWYKNPLHKVLRNFKLEAGRISRLASRYGWG